MSLQKVTLGMCALVMAAGFVSACVSGLKVSTMEVDGSRLRERESFAWMDRGDVGPTTASALLAQVGEATRRIATEQLTRKGYKEVPADQAEMLVSYQVVVTAVVPTDKAERVSGMSSRASVGPGDPFRELRDRETPPPETQESEGNLLVFVTDRATGRILWRGTAEALMTSPREGALAVPAAVRRMFERFPSRS